MVKHRVLSDEEEDMTPGARRYLIKKMGREWFTNNKFVSGLIDLKKAKEIVAFFKKRQQA